ncbi:MAG: hypothetical protein GF308_01840 [Candidatus Heimdallarchaeota archaeon]|nr:hypothetical protein [Candidatus Heimdallarchaeota archaeon]
MSHNMSLFSHASYALDHALQAGVDYADIRVENKFASNLGLRNGVVCGSKTQLQDAIGVRILIDGVWGFAATSSLDNRSIKRIIDQAIKTAKKIARNYPDNKLVLGEVPKRKTSVADDCKKNPQFIDFEDRMDLITWVNTNILSQSNDINLLDLKLIENHSQQVFFNSEGSEIEQILIRSSLLLGTSINNTNNFPSVRTVAFGGVGGIEQFNNYDFQRFLDGFIKTIPGIAEAKFIKPTKRPVVLNEEMGWNLCHEFCHAIESDLILENKSPLGLQIGRKIGSEKVTIVDDASFKGFGEYYFDDEGIKASGTLIMEDGILYDFLQNRETAVKLNAIPTSNGRAESALYPPQVRQSNTFFEPGDYSFNELLEEVKNGLFVCDSFGGNADMFHGNFQLDAQFGRKIVNGELGDYVTGFALVGNLYKILGQIGGFSKNVWSFPAFCGKKGQRVSVGVISPKVFLKNMQIIATPAKRQFRLLELIRQRER